MQKYQDTVLNTFGKVVPGAVVTVQTYPAGAIAGTYSDNGITSQNNPTTTDASGRFSFYAADGRYQITISGSGIATVTYTDILLEDPMNMNAVSATTVAASTAITLAGRNVASYSTDASGNVTGLVGPGGSQVAELSGISAAPSLVQIADYYLVAQTPPDYSIDFTQLASLPAGVTATTVKLSSKGAYVSNASEVVSIALATVLPSLTASAWSVEVDIELGTNPSLSRAFFEFGGTTNNRFTIAVDASLPGNYIGWGCVSTIPGLDIKGGSNPSSGVSNTVTITASNTGTNATIATNNSNVFTTGVIQAVSGTLSLNLGGMKSVAQSYLFGWVKAVRIWQTAITTQRIRALSPKTIRDVVCWGDSLTQGSGATPSSMGYVTQLSSTTGKQCINKGISGETSTQIKSRFFSDLDRTRALTNVFWVGRNNPSPAATVMADLDAMVSRLGHSRFLVLSVMNKSDGTENAGSAAYNNIVALNALMAAAYPNNYIDVRSKIVVASGGVNDAPSPSITADGLHLTAAGYTLVAGYVQSRIASF